MDVGLITRGATVVIKEKGSLIEFQFYQEPNNLHFSIKEENEEKSELPPNWSTDYSIGTDKPELKVENNKGIFRLSYCSDEVK